MFEHPPTAYRSAPFWSWNDDLEELELRRQIQAMHAAGQGGFFMHARVGLRTPYLSKRWFEAVRVCVDEAAKLGMQAWIYDEDNWPSGYAGGRVPSQDPGYRVKAVVCHISRTDLVIAEAFQRLTGRLDGNRLSDPQPWVPADGEPEDGRVLVQCYPWTAPLGNPWMSGTCYLDSLNPEAVEAFISSTYERYRQEVGPAFGATIPGIFTDEPRLGFPLDLRRANQPGGPYALPWTDDLPQAFQERHGYDLPPCLHLLFLDGEGSSAVRHDYWETVTSRFETAWSRQLFEWCDRHGLLLTGHMNAEDSLFEQMTWVGGVMQHYRWFHVPGIDKLGRHTGLSLPTADIDGNPAGAKQLESVAAQYGKQRSLVEIFGGAGQDFALRGSWWLTTWQAVLGTNFFNPHLALYSLRGERKRDYPPTLSVQQPYWRYQRQYEDAAGRLSYVLSQGRRLVDILVIHPLSSAWAAYTPLAPKQVLELDRQFERLPYGLLAMHRDFHYGDETILADIGRVQNGRLQAGECAYQVVLVPPVTTLRRSTVDLLAAFAAAGGTIVALRPGPSQVDGRPVDGSPLPRSTYWIENEVADGTWTGLPEVDSNESASPIPDLPALRATLDAVLPRVVELSGEGIDRVWTHHRRLPDGRETLFIANTRESVDVNVKLAWLASGRIERWDLLTGGVLAQPAHYDNGRALLDLEVAAGNGVLLVHDPSGPPNVDLETPKIAQEIALNGEWRVTLLGPNALVLDSAEVQLGVRPWRPAAHVLEIAQSVRSLGEGEPFQARLRFEIERSVPDGLELVVEPCDGLTLTVNGRPLPEPDGWWLDPVLQRHRIADLARVGDNLIEIQGHSSAILELEAVYLLGHFTVPVRPTGAEVTRRGSRFAKWRVTPSLQPLAEELSSQHGLDLVQRGLPHYVGELRLEQAVELPDHGASRLVTLEFDEIQAATALVEVNGVEVGQLSWPPYRVDITEHLRPGSNTISVRLVTTLRNLLGPFHTAAGDPVFVGPFTFDDLSGGIDQYWLAPLRVGSVRLCLAGMPTGSGA
jgi:hypothetical protein